MIPQDASPEVQAAFRDIYAKLDPLISSKNIDLKGRRVTGAGVSVDKFDYTTKFEVDKRLDGLEAQSASHQEANTALAQIKEVRIGTAAARPSATLSNAQSVYFASDTYVLSYNATGAAWASWLLPTLAQFFGTSASFPALKRSGVNIQARLADDSAYTDIEVLDEAYGAGWNASIEVPTKNAVYAEFVTVLASIAALNTTSGTYSPTLTNVANLDASSGGAGFYIRVGSVVLVAVFFNADPTVALTTTQLGISLPIASNIGGQAHVCGVAFCATAVSEGAAIIGDATNDRAEAYWVTTSTTNQGYWGIFAYRVI